MDWALAQLGTIDLGAIGWMLLAAYLGIPKGLAALEAMGKLPEGFARWRKDTARKVMEEEAAQQAVAALVGSHQALLKLATQSEAIFKQLRPNGGDSDSVGDTVARLEAGMTDALANVNNRLDVVSEEHRQLKVAVEAHVSLHLDGPTHHEEGRA